MSDFAERNRSWSRENDPLIAAVASLKITPQISIRRLQDVAVGELGTGERANLAIRASRADLIQVAVGLESEQFSIGSLNESTLSDIRPVESVKNRVSASDRIEAENAIEWHILSASHCCPVEIVVRCLQELKGACTVFLVLCVKRVQNFEGSLWADAIENAGWDRIRSGVPIEIAVERLDQEARISSVATSQRAAEIMEVLNYAVFVQSLDRSPAPKAPSTRVVP